MFYVVSQLKWILNLVYSFIRDCFECNISKLRWKSRQEVLVYSTQVSKIVGYVTGMQTLVYIITKCHKKEHSFALTLIYNYVNLEKFPSQTLTPMYYSLMYIATTGRCRLLWQIPLHKQVYLRSKDQISTISANS